MGKKGIFYRILGFGVISLVFVSGCTSRGEGSGGFYAPNVQMGNYKCTATNATPGGAMGTGWSTSRARAEANALDKCRTHSTTPTACRITQCISE